MKDLIKVEEKIIGDNKINSVDARDLYKFLKIKKQFTDWIRPKIKDYGFVINSDFYPSSTIAENGRKMETYIISIDMAKELAMTSMTDKGKEARKYFIACENKLKEMAKLNMPDFTNPVESAKAFIVQYEAKMLLAQTLDKEKDKIEFYNAVADTKGADSMSKVAKTLDLGIGRNILFAELREMGILMDDNEPMQRYMTAGYFKVVMYKYESGGQVITHYKTLVTKKGVKFILKKYLEKYPESSRSDVDEVIDKATNMTIKNTID